MRPAKVQVLFCTHHAAGLSDQQHGFSSLSALFHASMRSEAGVLVCAHSIFVGRDVERSERTRF